MRIDWQPTRRSFLHGTTATLGLGALAASPFGRALAANFPVRPARKPAAGRIGGRRLPDRAAARAPLDSLLLVVLF